MAPMWAYPRAPVSRAEDPPASLRTIGSSDTLGGVRWASTEDLASTSRYGRHSRHPLRVNLPDRPSRRTWRSRCGA